MKITIIIPFYNTVKDSKTEKFLQQNINSIINQTYKNIEVLYINNNSDSDDTSQSIIEDRTKDFNNIKILQEKQQGVSRARNKGIKEATGDYFTFIDSDDFVELDYIEEAVKTLTNKKVDMLIGLNKLELNKRKYLIERFGAEAENIYGAIKGVVAIFYKTEFIQKINLQQNTNITIGEDNLFNNIALLNTNSLAYYESKYYFCEYNRNSASKKKSDKFFTGIKADDILFTEYIKRYNKINEVSVYCYFETIKSAYDKVFSNEKYKTEALSLVKKYNLEIPKGFRFGRSPSYKLARFAFTRFPLTIQILIKKYIIRKS